MIHAVYLSSVTGASADILSQILDRIRLAFNTVIIWHSDYTEAVDSMLAQCGLKGMGLFGCPNIHDNWFAWTPHLGIWDSEIRRIDPYGSVMGYMLGTEINGNAFVRNLDTQLTEAEYISWLGRTSEIARAISHKPIFSDVIYLPNSGWPAYVLPSPAILEAYGAYRSGIFWSVGHTLANSRPEHVLYQQLRSISVAYGIQCLARTAGPYVQSQWFPNWIREIYANGARGLTLWRWESLYSTDAVTGVFSDVTYVGLVKVYNDVQTRGRNTLIGLGLLALAGLAIWQRKPLHKVLKKMAKFGH